MIEYIDSSLLMNLIDQVVEEQQVWILRAGNLISACPELGEPMTFKALVQDFYNVGIVIKHKYFQFKYIDTYIGSSVEVRNVFTGFSYNSATLNQNIIVITNLYKSISDLNLAIAKESITFFEVLCYKVNITTPNMYGTAGIGHNYTPLNLPDTIIPHSK